MTNIRNGEAESNSSTYSGKRKLSRQEKLRNNQGGGMDRPPKASFTAKHIQEQELLFNNLRTNTNAVQSHKSNNYLSNVANVDKNQSFSSSLTVTRLPSGLPLFSHKFPAEKEHHGVKSQSNYQLNIAISDDNASDFTDQPNSELAC